MTQNTVPALLGVRLGDEERRAVAEIMEALKGPRRPRVSLSDAIRASVLEMRDTVIRERHGGAEGH